MQMNQLFKTYESPEYKKLYECNLKQCKEHQKVYKRSQVIMEELRDLSKKATPDEKVIRRMLALAKELANLNLEQKALVCSMKKCTKEMAALQARKNKDALEQLKQAENMYESLQKGKATLMASATDAKPKSSKKSSKRSTRSSSKKQ